MLVASPGFTKVCGRSKHVLLLVKLLSENGYEVTFVTDRGERIPEMTEMGINSVLCPVPLGGYSPLNLIRSFLFFLKVVRRNDIGIIHTHHRYVETVSSLVRLFLRRRRLKLITTVHSELIYKGKHHFPSDVVVAISGFVEKELTEKHNVNKSKIRRIYNYAEETEIVLLPENKKPLIVSAGRFAQEKGFEVMFEAAKMFKEDSAEFVLMGEGKLGIQYFSFLPDLKIRAEILTAPPDPGVYFDKCDICVVPSRSEGLSYVIMEAGIRGKAVVAANTGGIPELIVNNETGLLFENGNAGDLYDKLSLLLNNPGLRKRLGLNLRNKLLKEFNYSLFRQQTLSLYEEL